MKDRRILKKVNIYLIFSVLAASDAAVHNFSCDFTPVLDCVDGVGWHYSVCKYVQTYF